MKYLIFLLLLVSNQALSNPCTLGEIRYASKYVHSVVYVDKEELIAGKFGETVPHPDYFSTGKVIVKILKGQSQAEIDYVYKEEACHTERIHNLVKQGYSHFDAWDSEAKHLGWHSSYRL